MAAQPLLTQAALERAFSKERIAGYRDEMRDRDEADTLSRYLWNIALGTAIQPALHTLEVAFRNEIQRVAVRMTSGRNYTTLGIDSWLDADPSFLLAHEQTKVEKAKSRLGTDRPSQTEGHLVAKLDFGFWVALCQDPYSDWRTQGPRLWPRALAFSFTSRPPEITVQSQIHKRFDLIRQFRNRIAHHEPIWDRGYPDMHECILDSLGWINRKVADAVRATSPGIDTYNRGEAAFRPYAETLIGGGTGLDAVLETKIRALGSERRTLVQSLVSALYEAPAEDPSSVASRWAEARQKDSAAGPQSQL